MNSNRIKSTRILKIVLFILGVFLLVLLISQVGLREIIEIILRAKIEFLIFGFLVYLLLILTRAFKWFLLIRITGSEVKYKEFLPFYFVNCLLGNITPLKSGEAATPIILKKYLKIPVGQGFSIVILDRFFELLVFTVIFMLAIFYIINAGIPSGLVLSIFQWVLFGLILLILILIIVIVSKRTVLKILWAFNLFKKYSLMEKFLVFIEKELQIFYDGLSWFKNKRVYKFMIPLTLICWFLDFLSFYFIVSSVLSASFFNIATAQVMAIAAALLTFIPVGIGIGELGIVYILNLFNYPTALSTTGALLARIILTGTLLTIGIIGTFLLRERKK